MKIKKLFAAVLAIVLTLSVTTAADAVFGDVPETHIYRAAIDYCEAKGIVKGTGTNAFMPEASLSRAQLAVIWCRYRNIKDINHRFKDITGLKKYYDNAVIVMNSLGVLRGISDTMFSPESIITREQLAVIIMRTLLLGAADPEAYKQYSDYALISEWARDGISSCINAGVFEGLYDEEYFQPQKAVTRAEVCKLIYNRSLPAYTVTIGTLNGGTITADPSSARPGTLITLTVTPAAGMRLKAGTLKYNDIGISGTTFTMPEEDVLITAEFEAEPVLESIAVTGGPNKTVYEAGQALDLNGLEITASYSDLSASVVTGYTTAPAEGSVLDTEGTITVTVSYTEGSNTKTTDFSVQVNAAQ